MPPFTAEEVERWIDNLKADQQTLQMSVQQHQAAIASLNTRIVEINGELNVWSAVQERLAATAPTTVS